MTAPTADAETVLCSRLQARIEQAAQQSAAPHADRINAVYREKHPRDARVLRLLADTEPVVECHVGDLGRLRESHRRVLVFVRTAEIRCVLRTRDDKPDPAGMAKLHDVAAWLRPIVEAFYRQAARDGDLTAARVCARRGWFSAAWS